MDCGESGFAPVDKLAVVGLGLIGGAVARAAKARGLARHVVAVGRRPADLQAALDAGIVDQAETNLAEGLAGADLIVLARPVEVIVAEMPAVLAAAPAGALVTDAGSTKAAIVAAAGKAARPGGAVFVGSHPMAGSDKTGWRHSTADLFEGATTIVTLSEDTDLDAVARAGAFWAALGSRIVYCGPAHHDALVGLVSHVPHMVAVGLAEQLAEHRADAEFLRILAGPGVRDTTRVAAGDPDLWQQICLQNPGGIADALEETGRRILQLAELVRTGNGPELRARLAKARDMRQALE
ncbi:MAG: prephenate dehydrogenase [Candidatus Sumerlaeota bacterium]|nr:prephenate dehydrogenase [Candidatus Sumerlaeota bacterium]